MHHVWPFEFWEKEQEVNAPHKKEARALGKVKVEAEVLRKLKNNNVGEVSKSCSLGNPVSHIFLYHTFVLLYNPLRKR